MKWTQLQTETEQSVQREGNIYMMKVKVSCSVMSNSWRPHGL